MCLLFTLKNENQYLHIRFLKDYNPFIHNKNNT